MNARYVLTYAVTKQVANNPATSDQETLTFNTGGQTKGASRLTCSPNGQFEQQVLAMTH